jgi:hypothetical protein
MRIHDSSFILPFLVSFISWSPLFAVGADYFEPKLLTGSIYDQSGGRVLFTFRRTAAQTGDVVRVLREFRNPNGSLAAQERVLYEGGHLMRFELDELQIGASGQAVIQSAQDQQQIEFRYTPGSGKTKRRLEAIGEQPLISDMLPGFLLAHWDELERGDVVRFRYIVVPRLETIAFKLRRESTAEFQGKKVVRIRMEPASWIIAQVLDSLLFTVELEPPHRILQYWGRTTPKIRNGQTWRDLDALTVFNWD